MSFERVQERFGGSWKAISAARDRTRVAIEKLGVLRELGTPTASIVVFGSLGRGELTSGSDADWTLLIDGQSDPAHFKHALRIGTEFERLGFKSPGPTGTFGQLSSSHELVHYIAGTRDSNENLTRRMLLLAESRAITNEIVRDAVLRNVLGRYVVHGRTVPNRTPSRYVIPHFLMNDVVRYWRTIASDYESKLWERDHRGWAVRNVKLRFSRKLIFTWGLLTCFSFELFPPEDRDELLRDRDALPIALADFILGQTRITPLDQLCRLIARQENETAGRLILDAYDRFLAVLDDDAARDHLDRLSFEDAADDELFDDLRTASVRFQDGITALFYDGGELEKLMKRFGVF